MYKKILLALTLATTALTSTAANAFTVTYDNSTPYFGCLAVDNLTVNGQTGVDIAKWLGPGYCGGDNSPGIAPGMTVSGDNKLPRLGDQVEFISDGEDHHVLIKNTGKDARGVTTYRVYTSGSQLHVNKDHGNDYTRFIIYSKPPQHAK